MVNKWGGHRRANNGGTGREAKPDQWNALCDERQKKGESAIPPAYKIPRELAHRSEKKNMKVSGGMGRGRPGARAC